MITKTLPETKMISWFDDHWYSIDGTFIPSVTTILSVSPKPFLANWRGQVGNWEANRIMHEAMDKGSRIHNAVSILVNGGAVIYNNPKHPSYTEEEISGILAESPNYVILQDQQEHLEVYRFSQFLETAKPLVIASEMIVYSLVNNYAGTLDMLLRFPEDGEYLINGAKPLFIPKGLYIADLKTGQNVDEDYYLQISAYKAAFEEGTEQQIDGGLIIHTNAQTKKGIEGLAVHMRGKEELEEDFQQFLKMKAVFDFKNPNGKPKIFSLPAIIRMAV